LKVGRFDELKQHLEALVALYNIDGDKYVFVSAINELITILIIILLFDNNI